LTVAHDTLAGARAAGVLRASRAEIRIGLLGVGHVGSAVARLVFARPHALGRRVRIASALVRDPLEPSRTRALPGVSLTSDPRALFAAAPTVVVEVLGGLEPARTLVLEALARGLPVVTANKALLAYHGEELLEAAASAGVPLRYEASVIAGVPFLGTFARRPLAADVTCLTGIVNGTTNYILTEIGESHPDYASALAQAQHHGFAEPDSSKDVDGLDAVEKLVVLIRQFARLRAAPDAIETTGIRQITAADLVHAGELGGSIKPVVYADWSGAALAAFAGPAFVPRPHPLAALRGVSNGICLRDGAGSVLSLAGPGAGPDITAVTVLDDVLEAVVAKPVRFSAACIASVRPPSSRWLVRITSSGALPFGADVADLLASHGIWIERTSTRDTRHGGDAQWLLTYPSVRDRIGAATAALSAATGCSAFCVRALEEQP
jgi:homoserine dehydrogenase